MTSIRLMELRSCVDLFKRVIAGQSTGRLKKTDSCVYAEVLMLVHGAVGLMESVLQKGDDDGIPRFPGFAKIPPKQPERPVEASDAIDIGSKWHHQAPEVGHDVIGMGHTTGFGTKGIVVEGGDGGAKVRWAHGQSGFAPAGHLKHDPGCSRCAEDAYARRMEGVQQKMWEDGTLADHEQRRSASSDAAYDNDPQNWPR